MNIPELDSRQLEEISQATIKHYDDSATRFWEGTRDHDVSQNLQTLIRHIKLAPPNCILDLGCGPGRDLYEFRRLGYQAVGLDGSARFCQMARNFSGCEVYHQDFLAMSLPDQRFDGIFANASLFHVPCQELPDVLRELWSSLKPGGILLASNPRGDNFEGWQGNRYGSFHDLQRWREFLNTAMFKELEYYYRPAGKPRNKQPWLVTVWQK